jgi:phosphopantothenoylcysteine decarboxylase/phosphopantothenate--cysteine ligase
VTYPTLRDRRVVVGVCGGIAAYKACEVVSRLRQAGAEVRVVMTPNATHFVGATTFRALSGYDVACDMFGAIPALEIEHISLAEFGEAMVIVAATANMLGKVHAGICDDLLTTSICAAAGQVIFAPAMNWRMWQNPITQRNVGSLAELGYWFVGPECGHLACGETGTGRLSPTEDILDAVDQALGPQDSALRGKRVLITVGPTREPLDPVRFLSNPSSGKMGMALAREALARGAKVTLLCGPVTERAPWRAEVVPVTTTQELLEAALVRHAEADVVVGAAAPADYRPRAVADSKIKKTGSGLSLELEETPDVLAALGAQKRPGQVHVGFAAETDDLLANAAAKLERKNLDLIVANDVSAPGAGFGTDTNEATMVPRNGSSRRVALADKRLVAAAIWDDAEGLLCRTPYRGGQ